MQLKLKFTFSTTLRPSGSKNFDLLFSHTELYGFRAAFTYDIRPLAHVMMQM